MPLDRVIHALYAAALDPSQWVSALELLGDELGGCALGTSIQRPNGLAGTIAQARIDPYYFNTLLKKFPDVRGNEMVAAMSGLPAAVAMERQAVMSDESYFSSTLYNEIFAPQGLAHSAVACAFRSPECFVPLGIFRRKGQEELSQREFDILKIVLPHLERAIHISLRTGMLEERQVISDEFLERLPFGVILLDRDGSVTHMNSAARDIAAANDGLNVSQGRLHAASLAEKGMLQRVVASSLQLARPDELQHSTALKISRPSLAAPYLLLTMPSPRSESAISVRRGGAIVFVIDPERRTAPSQAILTQLFDLTPTESRLALCMAGGDTLNQAGRKMGITSNTARVHIKSIFRKMDVNRQGDLIRRLLILASVAERSPDWLADK